MSQDRPGAPLGDDEVEARFRGLVADWESAVPAPEPEPARSLEIPVWRAPQGPTIDEILDQEEEEGFTPPPVALPPAEDLHYWGALTALVTGPLLILWVAFGQPFYATWWLLLGIALCAGGFGLLVLRAPHHRDPDDDDSGARV